MDRRRLAMLVSALSVGLSMVALPAVRTFTAMSARAQVLTPEPTPTPTAVSSIPGPSTVLFLQSSYAAMTSVGQIHADGSIADGTGSKRSTVHFNGDCDATQTPLRMRIRLQATDAQNRERSTEIVLAGKTPWERTRTGAHARWSTWRARKEDTAYALIVLAPMLCPIGSAAGTTALGNLAPIVVENLGAVAVDHQSTWQLRVTTKLSKGERITQDWYVDQRTRYWDRFVVTDTKSRKKDSSVTDIAYSKFNLAVQIQPPKE